MKNCLSLLLENIDQFQTNLAQSILEWKFLQIRAIQFSKMRCLVSTLWLSLQKRRWQKQNHPSPSSYSYSVWGWRWLSSPSPTPTEWKRPSFDPSEPQNNSSGWCDWSNHDRKSRDACQYQHSQLIQDRGFWRWPQKEKQGFGCCWLYFSWFKTIE